MKRRAFLATSIMATAGFSTLVSSCSLDSSDKGSRQDEESGIEPFELDEYTVEVLQEKMADGLFTSEQITRLYLERIEKIDRAGPRINAVIEINPDAISRAKSMDDERRAGKIRGPLHGIPVMVKDNIDTADRMMTTAGSLALEGHIAKNDAFIIGRLRDAGAVILGKTNLSEWANFRSTQSSSGWSSRGGQTKNPYILDHSPCGSSSGSAAAVAANMCAVAIGTETDGSITAPASMTGIVGIKPTVGLLSRSGIIPISHTQDTAGPMARTVTDASILLGILAGKDTADAATANIPGNQPTDYKTSLVKDGLRGKRIGVDKKQSKNQFLQRLFMEQLDLIKSLGAEVVEIDFIDRMNELGADEFEVLKFEFKYGINKYLAEAGTSMKSLADLIRFNQENEDRSMPFFKQEIFDSSQEKGTLDDPKYRSALTKSYEGSKRIIDELLEKYSLDAICGMTSGPACSIDTIYGDKWGEDFMTSPAAMSGYPHITVPCGRVFNLPVGLSFFSKAFSEPLLISLGYSFEQASKQRVQPGFVPSFLP